MDAKKHLENMKNFQRAFLLYIDNNKDELQNVEDLIQFLKDQFNRKSIQEIKETLQLIVNITNNYNQTANFYSKIDNFLISFKDEFKQTFSNFELFNIFKSNKRISFFFIKESIFQIDQEVYEVINDNEYWNKDYIKYFFNESKQFLSKELALEIESSFPDNYSEMFDEKRKEGLNDHYICKLIREDSIDDFVIYVNQTNYNLSSRINHSIFETNNFLLKKNPSLIEYAAFYNSIQVFKFLFLNKVELTPSLWIFAIHGKSADIIHTLEENHVVPYDKTYNECLQESIKCYSNEIAEYFINNYINQMDNTLCFEFHNYFFFPDKIDEPFFLFNLCRYNYIYFVEKFLQNTVININALIILQI